MLADTPVQRHAPVNLQVGPLPLGTEIHRSKVHREIELSTI